jgi:Amt family ammonium transporter
MAMNFMIYAIGVISFYFVGFGLMFGGHGAGPAGPASLYGNDPGLLASEFKIHLLGHELGLFGYDGFMLIGRAFDAGVMALFLFHMVFLDASCTIPTGALAERWKFAAFVAYGFVMSMLVYPIYGNWVWGGGWLAQLGAEFGLGHGHVDLAGGSVVHMTGGVTALVGVLVLGPRIGKFGRDGVINVLPAHSVPMYMLGTFILAFGWFGFNTGSVPRATDLNVARVAVNTMLASGAGSLVSMVVLWRLYGKPDPSFMCNGMLAGLVAITAGCAFVTPPVAVLIGAVAGVLVIASCLFVERVLRLDDPVGAISVHGVNGLWGILALGLFADGTYGGPAWNGVYLYRELETGQLVSLAAPAAHLANLESLGVTGLFYGNPSQLVAQLIGASANIVWVGAASFVMFKLIDATIGNRVSPEVELTGLDIPELGVLGYIGDDPKTPEGHLGTPGADPRPARLPPDPKKRFVVVVYGMAPGKIAEIWSELCQPSNKPSPDFLAIYPKMTLLTGNRFTFIDGDPEQVSAHVAKLFRSAGSGAGAAVKTVVER